MDEQPIRMYCGANDGGIKRGDRADTGDLQARRRDGVGRGGSGVPGGAGGSTGHPTAITDSLAEPSSGQVYPEDVIDEEGALDDLTIRPAEDGDLGLTNVGYRPPDDWAADSGPARTPEDVEEIEELPNEPATSKGTGAVPPKARKPKRSLKG
jgi:hypothetical protein